MKWTAFDQATAAALAAQVPNVAHAPNGDTSDAMESALDQTREPGVNSAAAVLMPARDKEHTLLITMKTKAATQPGPDDEPGVQPTGYAAGGFLGLSDDPIYEDDNKKK